MEDRIKIKVLGITYNQIQSGAYALILSEAKGNIRIPVVIGSAEAQSIAAKLEGVTLPRPLIHDVIRSMTRAFGIMVKEVFIYRFSKGVFFSEITLSDGDREVKIDSRTSDAIAIAMRTKSPIYTTREVIDETGFEVEAGNETADAEETADAATELDNVPLERFAVEELDRMLCDCIDKENYEKAAEIKSVIDKKKAAHQSK